MHDGSWSGLHAEEPHDLWTLRCRLPAHVGEVVAVVHAPGGRGCRLLLDAGAAFEVAADAAQAAWHWLQPGDLVCVRWVEGPGAMRVAVFVDGLDGTVAISSREVCADA